MGGIRHVVLGQLSDSTLCVIHYGGVLQQWGDIRAVEISCLVGRHHRQMNVLQTIFHLGQMTGQLCLTSYLILRQARRRSQASDLQMEV